MKRLKFKFIIAAGMLGILSALPLSLTGQTRVSDTLRLTLEKALEIAMSDNLNIKIDNQELLRVDYLKKEGWYSLLPTLNTSAQYSNNIYKPIFFSDFFPGGKMEVGSTHGYSVTTNLQVPLFSMSLYKNIQISEIDMKVALESARNTKIELVQQVKNSFYGIVMMRESLSVLRQSYQNARENAANIARMYEQGMVSEYDKIRSEVAVRNILPTLNQAENGLLLAEMQLKILLSIDMETPMVISGNFNSVSEEIENFSNDVIYNLENNSSLKQMELQKEKLNKTYELIRTQRLPSLAGFASWQIQMQSNEFRFNTVWPNSLSVGISLQIPIFNKFSVSLKEKYTKIGIQKLDYQQQLLTRSLSLAATNALNEMSRARIRLVSDREAVAQAGKGYQIAKVRYETGAGTVLELNDSEIALTTSRLNLNQTLYDFLKAKSELEKVTGNDNIKNQ
ncbi:MAG: TolC family protein [Bacteroidales bacterium]|jgi:outer membrane protein TolC|nr:TolC family protein [Bacteroidales bacterium]MDD4638767.1 TolC family protein [Bacteroidales bacterium]